MKIESKWMTGLASRFIKKALCNKFGCNMDVQLNGFRTTVLDDKLVYFSERRTPWISRPLV